MKFGQKLLSQQHEPWTDHYLDYNGLKGILTKGYLTGTNGLTVPLGSPSKGEKKQTSPPPQEVTDAFAKKLDTEVQKMVLFMIEEQGKVATTLSRLLKDRRTHQEKHSPFSPEEKDKIAHELYHTSQTVLNLLNFVSLSLTGLRKILKKHDKITKRKIMPLYFAGHYYSSITPLNVTLGQTSKITVHAPSVCKTSLPALLHEEDLNSLVAVLEALYLEVAASVDVGDEGANESKVIINAIDPSHFNDAETYRKSLSEPARSLTYGAPELHESHRKVFVSASCAQLKESSDAYTRTMSETASLLLKIHAAQVQLRQSGDVVRLLASTMLVEDSLSVADSQEDEALDVEKESREADVVSNALNLISTLLYMMSYYIVVPTSDKYAEKLGADASFAGIIIGMTPTAAIISSFLYSWWTSYSYKNALVFASVCSLLGNLFYALGLPANNVNYILLGRVLNGFGSARAINRRYIADSVSRANRTAASAAFVAAGAFGQAIGPAISSILNYTISDETNLYWQAENAPGWVMAVMWLLYTTCLVLYFKDPPKKETQVVQERVSSDEVVHTKQEGVPLIASDDSKSRFEVKTASSSFSDESTPFWGNIPVAVTFLLYFILRVVLEQTYCSVSLLTHQLFDWGASSSGLYLTIMSLLVLPTNLAIAYYIASRFEDRDIILGTSALMFCGTLTTVQYGNKYSVVQYVIGTMTTFLAANAMECSNMSLLTKTLPPSWKTGFFNAGFLSTEAGMIGRSAGNTLISACGAYGLNKLLNLLFGSMSAINLCSLLIVYFTFDYLEPLDDNDD